MPIRPILDKIVVLPTPAKSTDIEIISHARPLQGIVVGIGPLAKTVKVGDSVHYKHTSGYSVHNDNTDYRVIKENEILAVETPGDGQGMRAKVSLEIGSAY